MMCFDGFKEKYNNLPISTLKKNFDYTYIVNSKTGEQYGTYDLIQLKKNSNTEYALNLKIYGSGNAYLSGSIHKFWRNENYSLFTLEDCRIAFKQLFKEIECYRSESSLSNLEIGVNILLKFNPDLFINRIISYKGKEFRKLGKRENGIGVVCELAEYDLKIYNKSKEFNLPYHVLRIEKKIRDSKYLKRLNVINISDALIEKNAEVLLLDLYKSFDEVLFNDKTIDEKRMTTMQRIALAKYRNPKHWLKENMTKEERRNSKNRFRGYIKDFGKENYQQAIKDSLVIAVSKIINKDATFLNIKNAPFRKNKNE